jgi:hypothetical protein
LTKVNVDLLKGGFEPEVYRALQALKRKHRYSFEYEPEALEYVVSHWYTPDFRVKRKDNSVFFIESKGYFTAQDRSKLKQIKKQHPTIDLRLVFQKDNKLHKASNTRYSDWCQKNGFIYAISCIPEEWFNE